MTILRIYGPPSSALPFDLRDFLKVLAPRSLKASWTVSAVDAGHHQWFDATGPGGEILEAMEEAKERVSGYTLAKAARDTLQVISGEFSASLPQDLDRTWVIVRAIDSTFYEITTSDEEVIRRVQSTFKDVRPYDSPWKPSSGEA
ncbi:hypothetical protein OIU34_06565 [Pararhizobium sp. BT-229]|uniref:hypothetical protein n=1 Tax=Pararhizobium sp. BT-229 TaxID=2986923 RepID=UPI0021F76E13|nr:hypothetical protein [Pararhizobium sp. BT-229]MCV9961560.1 hypothetical protein [Pararhizobium sp. BT-229]